MDRVTYVRFPPDSSRIAFAPVLIGLRRGYFREHDIELEIVLPRVNSWVTLAEQEADVGASYVSFCADPRFADRMKAVILHEQNRPGHGFTTLLARPALIQDGSLTAEHASLRGKTIGLLPGRGDDFMAWYGALQQGGLTIDDVSVVPVPHDGPERERALREGSVDVVIGRGPRHVAQEVQAGLVRRWKVGHEVHPDLQAQFLVYTRAFMEARPAVGERFAAAYLRGVRDYCDAFDHGIGRDALVALLAEETGDTPELLTTMAPAGFMPDGLIDLDRLEREMAVLKQRDLLPAATTTAELADNRFVAAALKQIGEYRGRRAGSAVAGGLA